MARRTPDRYQTSMFDGPGTLSPVPLTRQPRLAFGGYTESGRRGEPADNWLECVMWHSRARAYPVPNLVQIQTAWDRGLEAADAARQIAMGTI